MPRPKGSKNRATIAKEFARAELNKHLKHCQGLIVTELEGVLKIVLQQALDGCRTSQKMLLDRGLPILRARENEDTERGAIHITINGQALPGSDPPRGVIIDGEKERPIPSAVTKTTFQ